MTLPAARWPVGLLTEGLLVGRVPSFFSLLFIQVNDIGELKNGSPDSLPKLLFLLFTRWIAVFSPPELSLHINAALTVSQGGEGGGGVWGAAK